MGSGDHSQYPGGRTNTLIVRMGWLRRGLLGFLLAVALGQAAQAGPAPREQTAKFNATLLAAMQGGGKLGFEGRYKAIDGVAREVFDFAGMARAAAGSYWGTFGADGQSKLIDAFTRLSVATYAARFDGFSGERFEVRGESPAGRGAVLVNNVLVKSTGEPVAINYMFRAGEGGWHVADVMLDGKFSELAVKRSEFAAVLKSNGLAGLLDRIEDRIRQFRAGTKGPGE